MTLLALIVTLAVVGVLLWLLNTTLSAYIDAKFLKLINVIVFFVAVLWVLVWVLSIFGVSGVLTTPIVIH